MYIYIEREIYHIKKHGDVLNQSKSHTSITPVCWHRACSAASGAFDIRELFEANFPRLLDPARNRGW